MKIGEKAVFNIPRSLFIAALAPVILLTPFISKAFHIDDTVFLWTARHIQSHPLDFYGFMANWYGYEMPMSQINQNPPLVSYYIALVASLFGWGEQALHAAFLLPAVGLSAGIFCLARYLSPAPLTASLIASVSPVFLVSSTNIMSDTMMVAFYVWAAALWVRGFEQKNSVCLFCAGILIAIAALTKYFGITMILLLLIYSLVHQRRVGLWLIYLIIPVIVLLGYQRVTLSPVWPGITFKCGHLFNNICYPALCNIGWSTAVTNLYRTEFYRWLPGRNPVFYAVSVVSPDVGRLDAALWSYRYGTPADEISRTSSAYYCRGHTLAYPITVCPVYCCRYSSTFACSDRCAEE